MHGSLPGAFSPDYLAARSRFRAAASALGLRLESYTIGAAGPSGEDLTIDVTLGGVEGASRVVVVSSGLHGVEGFFGSAVQVALLEGGLAGWSPTSRVGLILLHTLNPFGFAWVRRVSEDNVDLNRNFLLHDETFAGSPARYAHLDWLLNPRFAPSWLDPFVLKALLTILWYGMPELKQAVAGGQYDFPRGLFFGGHSPSTTRRVLAEQLPRWIGDAGSVLHIDLHTGLGRWATSHLLLDRGIPEVRAERLRECFGADRVKYSDPVNGIDYRVRGGLGAWCQSLFPDRVYDLVCAEFGTYSPVWVLAALREENQAHHWGSPGDRATRDAKRRLMEAFVPRDKGWRAVVVAQALELIACAYGADYAPQSCVIQRSR